MHHQAIRLRHMVRRMVQALGVLGRDDLCCHGLTLAQCHALVEVSQTRGLTLSELAARLRLDKSTVSRTVESLVAQGTLTRTPLPENRRCVAIEPTAAGEALCDALREEMEAFYRRLLHRIPEAKRELVLEAFGLFLDAVDAPTGGCPGDDVPETPPPSTAPWGAAAEGGDGEGTSETMPPKGS